MALSAKTLDFLVENRLNNSRDWYQAHKAGFQSLVFEPMAGLVEQLAPAMREIDPQLVTEPKTDRTISRVYRDTRFSKDKSLYRDVMWLVFLRDKKAFPDAPGFFFEFSPQGFRYGCGYYSAPPKLMDAIRSLVLNHDRSFLLARDSLAAQPVFTLEGEKYKRPRYPDAAPEEQDWLDRKGISFLHNSKDFDLLFSDRLADTLSQDFELLKPAYEFLCRANSLAQSGESNRPTR